MLLFCWLIFCCFTPGQIQLHSSYQDLSCEFCFNYFANHKSFQDRCLRRRQVLHRLHCLHHRLTRKNRQEAQTPCGSSRAAQPPRSNSSRRWACRTQQVHQCRTYLATIRLKSVLIAAWIWQPDCPDWCARARHSGASCCAAALGAGFYCWHAHGRAHYCTVFEGIVYCDGSLFRAEPIGAANAARQPPPGQEKAHADWHSWNTVWTHSMN